MNTTLRIVEVERHPIAVRSSASNPSTLVASLHAPVGRGRHSSTCAWCRSGETGLPRPLGQHTTVVGMRAEAIAAGIEAMDGIEVHSEVHGANGWSLVLPHGSSRQWLVHDGHMHEARVLPIGVTPQNLDAVLTCLHYGVELEHWRDMGVLNPTDDRLRGAADPFEVLSRVEDARRLDLGVRIVGSTDERWAIWDGHVLMLHEQGVATWAPLVVEGRGAVTDTIERWLDNPAALVRTTTMAHHVKAAMQMTPWAATLSGSSDMRRAYSEPGGVRTVLHDLSLGRVVADLPGVSGDATPVQDWLDGGPLPKAVWA